MPECTPVAFPGAGQSADLYAQPDAGRTVPRALPALEITFAWGVTDGSAPETVSVAWGDQVPPQGEVLAVIAALADTGNRYTVVAQEEGRPEPVLDPMDPCRRPSCGHPRVKHKGGTGGCSICEESTVCPAFWEQLAGADWTGGA